MKRVGSLAGACCCLLAAVLSAGAGTVFYADASRPDDGGDGLGWATAKRTIQAAVDLARDGDEVRVADGVYGEGTRATPGYTLKNRLVITNAVTVRSANGAAATVIAGAGAAAYNTANAVRCVYMSAGVLDGFTLQGGATVSHATSADEYNKSGGCVSMLESAPGTEVRNCILRGGKAYDGGGSRGGRLVNCLLTQNAASYGGAAYRSDLKNCTVAGNSAVMDCGGAYICGVTNSILYGNGKDYHISEIAHTCATPLPAGPGNIASDPLFVDAAAGDYRLRADSPCADAGDSAASSGALDLAGNARVQGAAVDMGAYERVVVPPEPRTFYADASRPDDGGDGLGWATAKRTIQAAVDLARDGDEVRVADGVYGEGTRATPGYTLKNRLVLTNAVTVRSVNGAAATVIAGAGAAAYNTANAVRCVYMSAGVLEGFTLRGGATVSHYTSTTEYNKSGGGVSLLNASAGTEVRNCVITNCRAYDGGGAYQGCLVNCLLYGNYAEYGGGAYVCALNNCTLSGNNASFNGGGAYACGVTNSISFFNGRNNYAGGAIAHTCATPLPAGPGNLAADPLFVDAAAGDYRLQAGSPCVNAGTNAFVWLERDLAGNLRLSGSTVDMGAFERDLGAPATVETPVAMPGNGTVGTNKLTVALTCMTPDSVIRFTLDGGDPLTAGIVYEEPIELTQSVTVRAVATKEGMLASAILASNYTVLQKVAAPVLTPPCGTASELPISVEMICSTAGATIRYTVDGSEPTVESDVYAGTVAISGAKWVKARAFFEGMLPSDVAAAYYNPRTLYADASRPDDGGDGLSWATAKRTIQAAVDLAQKGETVLVAAGVYSEGGQATPGYALWNRVVLTNAVTVRSANGAAATVIEGAGAAAYATPGAVRCVYMSNGVLDGFTLRNGATYQHVTYENSFEKGGGGVSMFGSAAPGEVRNCVITQCRAYDGGGVYFARLVNCLVYGNSAMYGGGAYASGLLNCTLAGNVAMDTGGAYVCGVTNSILYGNGKNYHTGAELHYTCATPLPAGPGNIASDPLFVDAAAGDYRLRADSPCADAGDSAVAAGALDLAGNARVQGAAVDMGAYEGRVKLPQTVTVDPVADKTYGDDDFELEAGASSGLDVAWTSLTPDVVTLDGNRARITGVGDAVLVASQPGDDLYMPAQPVTNGFAVAKARLSARGADAERVYGLGNPALTVAYEGFVKGETAAVLDTPAGAATAADAASPVGVYPITVSGGADDHYAFEYQDGALTVTPAALTIRPLNQAKIYGDTFAFAGSEFTAEGLVNGDSVTGAALASGGAAAAAAVGVYPITASGAQGTGLSNYAVTYGEGVFTVGVPAVEIAPASGTRFTNEVTVTLACPAPEVTIRYTLDGSEPAEASAVYSNAFVLTATTRVRARGFSALAGAGEGSEADLIRLYEVAVAGGTVAGAALGYFEAGSNVVVAAGAPPAGQVFGQWAVEPFGSELGAAFDASEAETVIAVPPHTVALAALTVADPGAAAGQADVRLLDAATGLPVAAAEWSSDGRTWYPQGLYPLRARAHAFRFRSTDPHWLAPANRTVTIAAGEVTAVTALFTWVPVVRAEVEGQGSVALSPASGQVLPGKRVTLAARPAVGHVFVRWTDGELNASRSEAPAEDAVYTAVFMAKNDDAFTAGPPELALDGADAGFVGVVFGAARAEAAPQPAQFAARGLPPGLKIDRVTGEISGTPNRAGAYAATITAVNPAGLKATVARVFTIAPLPAGAQGAFSGVLLDERRALCGTFTLTASALGRLSAKVLTVDGSVSFSGAAWAAAEEGVFEAELQTSKGESLALRVDAGAGLWTFGVAGEATGGAWGDAVCMIAGQRNAFADRAAETADEAAAVLAGYAGYYTVALPTEAVDDAGEAGNAPQGSGYVTFTVKDRGAVTLAGQTADGTALSGAATLLVTDEGVFVPLLFAFGGRRGGVSGLLAILPGAQPSAEDNLVRPTAPILPPAWRYAGKAPSANPPQTADRFAATLGVSGGFYDKVANLALHYEGGRFIAQVPEVTFTYAKGAYATTVPVEAGALPDLPLAIHPTTGALSLPRGALPVLDADAGAYAYDPVNPAVTDLSVTKGTGLWRGTFNLYFEYEDAAGAPKLQKTSVRHAGVLTPLTKSGGQGYYLVPESWRAPEGGATYPLKRSYRVSIVTE